MIKRSLLTLAILLPGCLVLGAHRAEAQGLAHWRSAKKDLEARRVRSLISEDEASYLDNLALTLGPADESGPVEIAYGPEDLQGAPSQDPRSAPRRSARARGLWSKIGGLEVLRFRFQSEEHAQRFAIYAAETEGRPTLLEVRGKQLVIARGERVQDPQDLERIRSAAWAILPHAPGAPSVAGLTLSRSDHAYELRIPNAELDRLIEGAFAESEAKPGKGDVLEGPVLTQTWSGHASRVTRHEDRKTLWVSRGDDADSAEPRIKALAEGMFAVSERLAQDARENPPVATRSLGKARGLTPQAPQGRPRRVGFDTVLGQAKSLR